MLGVDTFFDIHYNVGRNGAKWDAYPKNRRNQRRAWEKSEHIFCFWDNRDCVSSGLQRSTAVYSGMQADSQE